MFFFFFVCLFFSSGFCKMLLEAELSYSSSNSNFPKKNSSEDLRTCQPYSASYVPESSSCHGMRRNRMPSSCTAVGTSQAHSCTPPFFLLPITPPLFHSFKKSCITVWWTLPEMKSQGLLLAEVGEIRVNSDRSTDRICNNVCEECLQQKMKLIISSETITILDCVYYSSHMGCGL